MPPRTPHRDITSDLETKSAPTSRAANKARNAVAVAAQQELLSKHIHSNGPQDKVKVDPLDFKNLNEEALKRYNVKYALNLPSMKSISEDILHSEIGKKTFTAKQSSNLPTVSKEEVALHCQKHFIATPCRENEIITSFLYKVKNETKEFKYKF